ncbi:hypothetical protein OBK22_09140 [Empedobacter falsenii]
MKINKLYLIISIINCTFGFAQNSIGSKINTKINNDFISSIKSFVGKLNPEEYKETRKEILKELKVEIPEEKAILIHFYQYGVNCYEYGLKERNALGVIQNTIKISSKISKENNTIDFFIYTSNALHKERIQGKNIFILDSGFFEKNIFTLKENCRAFFILKTNGEFMKYYGSDYFTEVSNFLKKQ